MDLESLPNTYPDALVEIRRLVAELGVARQNAMRFELEAHALRREMQHLRANCDTARIHRDI